MKPVLVIGCAVAVIWLFNSPALQVVPGRDSGVFLYVADRWLNGDVPYRDTWDHKGPVLYAINALGLWLAGWWGVWLLEVAALTLAAGTAFALVRRFASLPAAALAVALLLCSVPLVASRGNKSELWVMPLQFVALWAWRRGRWGDGVVGITGGLAFFIQPNLVTTWVVLGTWALVERQVFTAARMIISAGAVTSVVLGYFAYHHALGDLWSALLVYNVAYSNSATWITRIMSPMHGLGLLAPSGIALGGAIGWGMARRKQTPAVVRAALWILPVEVIASSISGHAYPQYFLAWLPALTLLAAYAASLVSMPWVLWVLVGVAASQSVLPWMHAQTTSIRTDVVTPFIQAHTGDGETVLLWGAETRYNFTSGRPAPSRFSYLYPLMARGYGEALSDEFAHSLTDQPPALVIDASRDVNVQPFRVWLRGRRSVLEGRYHYTGTVGEGWLVFEYH